jgi:tRNA A-37 threonylcarbamoyl transferase component Bud32
MLRQGTPATRLARKKQESQPSMQARSAFASTPRFPASQSGSAGWITDSANVVRRVLVRDGPTPTDAGPTSTEVRAALRRGESARARAFGRAIILPCVFALGLHLTIGRGDPLLHKLTSVALASLGLAGAYVWWRSSDAAVNASNAIRVFGAVALVASFIAQAYLGVLSSAAAMMVLGISFFGMGERPRAFRVQFLVAVVAYVVYGVLVSLGVLPDRGLISVGTLPLQARVGLVGLTASLAVIAAMQARSSRRAMASALQQVERVTREVRVRESQLAEERHNLDIAVRAWRDRGRYAGTWAGPYQLTEIVGRGAMGEVYAATDPRTGERAAVKLLRAEIAEDPAVVKRFLREATIASKLRSPHLVEVRAAGQLDDGSPFIAMELLRGCDLGWSLRHSDRFDLDDVVVMTHDIAAALDVAHRAGVVHRDLKPQNVFRAQHGNGLRAHWKVLDIGVCALRGSNGTLTERYIIGTPHYMSPEQVLGQASDHRTDVFAMGVLLYRVLTGQLPFGGDGPSVLYGVVHETPTRPRDVVPWLPADVERVLALALAKSPDHRFASAVELGEALRDAAREDLSAGLRARADALVRAAPWGVDAPTVRR